MTINLFSAKINIKKEHILISAILFAILVLLMVYVGSRGNKEVIIDTGEAQAHNEEDSDYTSKEKIDEKQKLQMVEDTSEIKDKVETGEVIETKGNTVSDSTQIVQDTRKLHEEKEIKVYIIGCVNNPGIITLKEGQLLYEAIEAAGGATEEADLQNINMVYPLTQNIMINILPKNIDRANAKDEKENNDIGGAGSGIQIIKDTGGGVIQFTGKTTGNADGNKESESEGTQSSKGKVNINKATIDELDTLPGIGKATAEDIIEYRESNGKYEKIEDIMQVPRIKEKRFEQIKDFITVD